MMNPLFDAPPARPSETLAQWSVILFVGGLFLSGGVLSLVGLILGIVAWHRANKYPEQYGGKGMAKAFVLIGAAIYAVSIGALVAYFLLR